MSILTHVLAAIGGGFVGIAVMALCFAASKADEAEERMLRPEDKQHSGLLEDEE